ncbi:hypothetical protein PoB_004943300 [Plakobranchus ocellatus]|uniref:Uncharacterized protein n=1 Tax=Plakobranchus ocellatus TaxID=259542 RepID=A0AAV4BTK1_9GAST|nr:hypothetical protein PoB_004943300 [Plakobranchus ocellatus]
MGQGVSSGVRTRDVKSNPGTCREDAGDWDGLHGGLRKRPFGPYSNLGGPRENSEKAPQVNLTKCVPGAMTIDFLGHWLGERATSLQKENAEKFRLRQDPRAKRRHPQRLGYRFALRCALVVATPTITDMSGSSGLLAHSTFPTMTSQMASGMHNAFTSPLR